MNSKLPPKYTILFLLLFSIPNKVETALNSAQLYLAHAAYTGEAFVVSTNSSIVSDSHLKMAVSGLESYQWYTDIEHYI